MYNAQARETEALQTAQDRDYALNPWRLHGAELNRIHQAIADELSFTQYTRWSDNAPADFRRRFTDVARVTKSRKVLALAAQGLELVTRCEALTEAQKDYVVAFDKDEGNWTTISTEAK